MSQTRKFAIAGAAALAGVVVLLIWVNRPADQPAGSPDELVERLTAATPDQREGLMVELGRRGPQVIPQATAAYEKAGDPNLRIQLATVIFRTNSPAQAVPALDGLLQKEKDSEVRRAIEDFLAGLRRPRGGTR